MGRIFDRLADHEDLDDEYAVYRIATHQDSDRDDLARATLLALIGIRDQLEKLVRYQQAGSH